MHAQISTRHDEIQVTFTWDEIERLEEVLRAIDVDQFPSTKTEQIVANVTNLGRSLIRLREIRRINGR
jgi:hypothetical protein